LPRTPTCRRVWRLTPCGRSVRTIIVETANRFARDLITQETGWRFLRDAGIALIAADSPDAFLDDTPTAVMIRQILGSVAQFEKGLDPTVVPPAAISKKPPDSCLSRSKDTIEAGAFGISSVETGANLG